MVDVTVCVQSEETFVVRQRVNVDTGHPRTQAELEAGEITITFSLMFSHLNIGIVLGRHSDLIVLTMNVAAMLSDLIVTKSPPC